MTIFKLPQLCSFGRQDALRITEAETMLKGVALASGRRFEPRSS
jgi:hypothetical protein